MAHEINDAVDGRHTVVSRRLRIVKLEIFPFCASNPAGR